MTGNGEGVESASRFKEFDPVTITKPPACAGMVDPSIKPAWAGAKVCGPALTVACPPGDNLMLHHAVASATAGVVIVATLGGYLLTGAWGEILTQAAKAKGVAGLVVDGAVRDIEAIAQQRFPVFSRGLAIGACTKERPGLLGVPVSIGGATVSPGDIIVGDSDGLVTIQRERADEIYAMAERRRDREKNILAQLSAGKTTIEILSLPPLPPRVGEGTKCPPQLTTDNERATNERRFAPEALTAYAGAVLRSSGVPEPDARTVAECLVLADLRGVDSRVLIRLIPYTRRIQAGVVKAQPQIEVTKPFPAIASVDGDNGLGPVVGLRAMQAAIEIAEVNGIGFAGVRGSNHFGVGAFYVDKAVRAGMLGCAISNAPPNMAPFGGRERFLGTNPFAVGIPVPTAAPMIFDASSSVAARGKIIAAAAKGQPIPSGWAIDPEGVPTTDAKLALLGAVLPFGAAKGSAISFIIDILSGTLTGAAFGRHLNTLKNLNVQQNVGHVCVALRRDAFIHEAVRCTDSGHPADARYLAARCGRGASAAARRA